MNLLPKKLKLSIPWFDMCVNNKHTEIIYKICIKRVERVVLTWCGCIFCTVTHSTSGEARTRSRTRLHLWFFVIVFVLRRPFFRSPILIGTGISYTSHSVKTDLIWPQSYFSTVVYSVTLLFFSLGEKYIYADSLFTPFSRSDIITREE